MNNDFYQTLNEPIANEVDDHNDLLYNRNPELSVNNQITEIENFIKNGVKVIFINPVDGNSPRLIRVLKKAHQRGIKIIVVDSQLKNPALCSGVNSEYLGYNSTFEIDLLPL